MLWLFLLSVVFFGLWRTVKFALFYLVASVAVATVLLLAVAMLVSAG